MSQEIRNLKYCPEGHSPKDLCYEFKTWSSGNVSINKIIQESQISNIYPDGEHGSVYSAEIENGIKCKWNFLKQDWEVALKEIKDSRFDIV
ncbi:hypothetical protein Glove_155g74 [Diversispora epigaea]|uniref:Uncharacterized protein n=1 Tax=Diversispora epigaea TaxID=1348612 RepID=A0A397IS63_9GLOM|nr:hypothetical protein Glove_155g74 [Diversispora epigaea]